MKLAIADVSQLRLPARPRPTAAALYRMAGLAIAIGVPTLFWTLAVALATKATGVVVVAAPALAAFGVIIAAWCLAGAALVMGASGGGQADSGVPRSRPKVLDCFDDQGT